MCVVSLSLATLMLLVLTGLASGCFGAWVGIGGGIILVPALVLGFGIDPKIAIATSLLAVIATSSAAGSVYVGRGLANTRLAIALEVATSAGGVIGGLIAIVVPSRVLAGVFAVVMAGTALLTFRRAAGHDAGELEPTDGPVAGTETPGSLAGSYYDAFRRGRVRYQPRAIARGSAISLAAGAASGLLGVGGGFMKVPAMNLAMRVPIAVSVATSNFMIGVTAAASVFVYFGRGYVHPLLVAPVALGVIGGALGGARLAGKAHPALVKRLLAVVLIGVAVQMAVRAFG